MITKGNFASNLIKGYSELLNKVTNVMEFVTREYGNDIYSAFKMAHDASFEKAKAEAEQFSRSCKSWTVQGNLSEYSEEDFRAISNIRNNYFHLEKKEDFEKWYESYKFNNKKE